MTLFCRSRVPYAWQSASGEWRYWLDRFDLGHHPLVFVIEDVAVKDELAADDRIAKVHQHHDRTGDAVLLARARFRAMWNDETVRPVRMRHLHAIDTLH